jgi:hypothetical protein
MKKWLRFYLRKRTYIRNGITIISVPNTKELGGCESCFFMRGSCSCNYNKVALWGVPDCVFDFPLGKGVVYLRKP